jgi:hypothetical protein
MGELRNAAKRLKGRCHFGDLGVDADNIKMDVKDFGWEGVDWIHLDQDRVQWRVFVNTVMNLRVP